MERRFSAAALQRWLPNQTAASGKCNLKSNLFTRRVTALAGGLFHLSTRLNRARTN